MKCLICGSDKREMLTQLCSNMNIMGPFFQEKVSSIVACRCCGHVYVDIDAPQEAFTEYYSSEYSKSLSYSEVFGAEHADHYYANIVKRLEKYVCRDGKILEIGGGIGELAAYLQNHGFADITVLEPSPRCLRLCGERGISVISSDAMEPPKNTSEKYDFIIINHTLEHILRFDLVLKTARAMLKKEGHIYIEVPDASRYKDTDFVPYWFFTYEHLFHMSPDFFGNMAAAFQFEVVEKESYLKCNSYHVMYAIVRKTENRGAIVYTDTTIDAVKQYIVDCETKLQPVIEKLERSQEPLILWGVGTSTAQLLNKNFDNCNVRKLIDSNPYRQQVTYCVGGKALKIMDPSTIQEADGTILILPLMYDASIRKQITEMKLKNRVMSLIRNFHEK